MMSRTPQKRFTSFTTDVATRAVITGGNEVDVRTSCAEKIHRSHHGESQEVLVETKAIQKQLAQVNQQQDERLKEVVTMVDDTLDRRWPLIAACVRPPSIVSN